MFYEKPYVSWQETNVALKQPYVLWREPYTTKPMFREKRRIFYQKYLMFQRKDLHTAKSRFCRWWVNSSFCLFLSLLPLYRSLLLQITFLLSLIIVISLFWLWLVKSLSERWGAGVETQKNVRGEIGGSGRVPFNETYAPSLSTIYDGA